MANMRLRLVARAILRARVLPRLPTSLLAGDGIEVDYADGIWTITNTAPGGGGGGGVLSVANGGTNASSASGTSLDNITGFSSTGMLARTGSGAYAFRTITGTTNEITATNGSGVSGNPTLSLPAALTFTGKTVTGGIFTGLTSVEITSGNALPSPLPHTSQLVVQGPDADSANIAVIGVGGQSDLLLLSSNGTAAARTASTAGTVSVVAAYGYTGSVFPTTAGALLAFSATETWSGTDGSGAQGMKVAIHVTASTTATSTRFLHTTFFDSGGLAVGTGAADPGFGKLNVSANATSVSTSGTPGINAIGANSAGTGFSGYSFANAVQFLGIRANGTAASKTALANGNLITAWNGYGYDGSASNFAGGIDLWAAAAWDTTGGGHIATYMTFYTNPAAGTSLTEVGRFASSGGFSVGTTSDPKAGGIFANVALGVGTNTTTATFVAIAAGTTAKSQINFASSTAPSAPVDGDFWFDGTNLIARISSASSIVARAGKQTIWIPAVAMKPRSTNGAALNAIEMATNKNMITTLDYDTTTQEFAQVDIPLPKSWNNGTITFVPYWSHPATTTNFGVVWGVDAIAISDGDALDVAFGTEQTSTDTGGTTDTMYVGPESSAITIAGTPATADMVQFRIHRDPASGSDTLAVDARLHGVKLFYTTSAANDA